MKNKKGFIKIVEAILASFLLFFILVWITSKGDRSYSYDMSLLAANGRDALASLDKVGVLRSSILNNDLNRLRNEIYKILPYNTRAEIEIIHLNKNIIKIGCNCTYEEKERFSRMIGVNYPEDNLLYLRGRNIRFEILQESSLNEMKNADIIVFFGCRNLSNYYNYINEGKSFLMISTVACENYLFNLTPKLGSAEIFTTNKNYLEPFRIQEYFVDTRIRINNNSIFWIKANSHTINIYLDNNSIPYLTYDNNPNIRYYAGDIMMIDGTRVKIDDIGIDYNSGRVFAEIRIIDRNYEFHLKPLMLVESNEKSLLISSGGYSASQLNYYITNYGRGKAAWISDYSEDRTDINQLMRAIIFWLSEDLRQGEKIDKNYVSIYYIVSGNSDFEPYLIKLNLWYIY